MEVSHCPLCHLKNANVQKWRSAEAKRHQNNINTPIELRPDVARGFELVVNYMREKKNDRVLPALLAFPLMARKKR